MNYTVEYAASLQELTIQVNKWLRIGWRPAGGLATFVKRDDRGFDITWFAQAVKQGGRAK